MKIGIDLDEVLADYRSALVEFHNTTYGTSIRPEDFVSYEFWKVWGGTREEAIDRVYKFHKTDFFKNIKPVFGSQMAIDFLKQNHELFIITSRQEDFIEETMFWVELNFPKAFKGIYFTNKYSKNGPAKTKVSICDELEIDILIDDSLDFAKECVNEKRKIFLLDYVWNQTTELPEKIFRVGSWPEILENI